MWVMSNLVSVHLEMMLVSVQDRCTVCAIRTIGSVIIFLHTRSYSEVMRLKWKLISICLEIVLIMTQDRCIVYVEHTIGSQIILVIPDGTPR
jgi:hypothetical protein